MRGGLIQLFGSTALPSSPEAGARFAVAITFAHRFHLDRRHVHDQKRRRGAHQVRHGLGRPGGPKRSVKLGFPQTAFDFRDPAQAALDAGRDARQARHQPAVRRIADGNPSRLNRPVFGDHPFPVQRLRFEAHLLVHHKRELISFISHEIRVYDAVSAARRSKSAVKIKWPMTTCASSTICMLF